MPRTPVMPIFNGFIFGSAKLSAGTQTKVCVKKERHHTISSIHKRRSLLHHRVRSRHPLAVVQTKKDYAETVFADCGSVAADVQYHIHFRSNIISGANRG